MVFLEACAFSGVAAIRHMSNVTRQLTPGFFNPASLHPSMCWCHLQQISPVYNIYLLNTAYQQPILSEFQFSMVRAKKTPLDLHKYPLTQRDGTYFPDTC